MTIQHHPFGPSRLGQRAACPGSYSFTLGDEDETNADSEEGSTLHAYVAHGVEGTTPEEGELPPLDLEQEERVEECVEFFLGITREARGQIGKHTELTMALDTSEGTWAPYGTCDLVVIHKESRTAWVVDWKFGRNELAEDSAALQMAGYAALVLQRCEVNTVHVRIYQPRLGRTYQATHLEGEPIIERIEGIRDAALADGAPRVPSADACRYCSGATRCPELTAQSMAVAVNTDRLPTHPDAVDEMYDKVQAAKKFLAKLEAELKDRIREGLSNNWTTQEKGGKRKIANPAGLYRALHETVPLDEFIALGSWPMEKVRKLSGLKAKAFNEVLEPFVKKGDDYTAIVRKRKEVEDV